MKIESLQIGQAPAMLYGAPAEHGYVFLHGQAGCKEEAQSFAGILCPAGFQVLSIDLPDHGARQGRGETLTPWTAIPDIQAALRWSSLHWKTVSLRANSIGAYFAMLAFPAPARALLVSPVLDMEQLILTMMEWAGVTEEQLRQHGTIRTDSGQTLSWEYLCWVREHPVMEWTCPVHILYGSEDHLTPRRTVEAFARRRGAQLSVLDGGAHWFHTPEQLAALQNWEAQWSLSPEPV